MYDDAKVANQNNRKLQNSIRGFRDRKLQPENRPIKSFPKFSPKEAEIQRKKLRKSAIRRQIITIVIYTITIIAVFYFIYQLQ